MNFTELTEKARSYRRFQEAKPIPSSLLRMMIGAAAAAPCASNLQRLRFSIVTGEHERNTLFPGIGWAGYITDWSGPVPGERPSAYIVVHAPEEDELFTGIDAGIAASHIVLAGAAHGVGSCILLNYDVNAVNRTAHAAGYKPILVIALGYPGETVVLEKDSKIIRYWRDETGVHHVPKLPLETLILKG
jgi:nitroreductase